MPDPIILKFNGGAVTSKDPVLIGEGQLASALNLIYDNSNIPQKIGNFTPYNPVSMGGPVKGQISFLGEDGAEYTVCACNGKLYWTSGNGVQTAVKFYNNGGDVTLDTVNHFYSFLLYDTVFSSTQQKIVYVTTDKYPIATNTTGTGIPNVAFSRALRLQIYNSTIIAVLVYSSTDGSASPGTDEVSVGSSVLVPFPKSALWMIKIYDRMVAVNYADAINGYIVSTAQAAADPAGTVATGQAAWTGITPDPAAMVGGGKYPEKFNGGITYNSSILLFSRHTLLRVDCAPGPIGNWRETFVPTTLGCICPQSITVHSDGWVYYVSEQGICRTNGVIAERVDWDIQDDILALSQIKNKSFSLVLASSSDWNVGTPTNGDNILNTTGPLSQLPQVMPTPTVILNPSFEQLATNWTNSTFPNQPLYGSPSYIDTYFLSLSGAGTYGVFILDSSNNVLLTYTGLGTQTSWTYHTIPESDLTPYIGTSIKIRFTNTSQFSRSDAFLYRGGPISFRYRYSSSRFDVDDIITYLATPIVWSLDFGVTPSSLGSLSANVIIPEAGGSVVFTVTTSSDNITYSSPYSVGTQTTSGAFTALLNNGGAPNARYVKVYAALNKASSTSDHQPSVAFLITGSQWISAVKDLGIVPASYASFVSAETLNGQSIGYEMNTSANGISWDGWVSVVNGAIPSNPLKRYIQFRLTLDTGNYTQIPQTTGLTLNYGSSTAAIIFPCAFSWQDRLYFSFMSNAGTSNDYMWVGFTKPTTGLAYEVSQYSQLPYPIWSKLDFKGAMSFSSYRAQLLFGDSSGNINFLATGISSNVCTATSSFVTKAIGSPDAESTFDSLYLYASGNTQMNLYFRTKRSVGSQENHDWSAWSSPMVLQLQQGMGRAIQVLQASPLILADTAKINLPGLYQADFIQFKLEQTHQDSAWGIAELHVYLSSQEQE